MAAEHHAASERTPALSPPESAPLAQHTTPRRGAAPLIAPSRPAYKWWVAGTVMCSAFLVVVNTATVNVTLPPMMTAFGMNLDQAQWVITAYMIASAVLIPTVGWLGNRLGNRNLMLGSLLVFVGSSALCGLAWSGETLILFRVIQGMGGGPITPMVMVFLSAAFPERQRGLAMGLYGMAAAFGPAVGPVLGGYVTEHLSWRMVFYMNIVPGLCCIGLVWLVIPNTRETTRHALDLAGLLTLVVLLVSLLLALTQGQQRGWDTPYIQRLLLTAGIALVAFVGLELWQREPLVDLRLYASGAFTAILQQGFGGAVGLALMTTVLQRRTVEHAHLLDAQQSFSALPWAEVLGEARDLAAQVGGTGALADTTALALVSQHLARQASVAAYQDCFALLALMAMAAMPFVCFLRQRQTG